MTLRTILVPNVLGGLDCPHPLNTRTISANLS